MSLDTSYCQDSPVPRWHQNQDQPESPTDDMIQQKLVFFGSILSCNAQSCRKNLVMFSLLNFISSVHHP